LIFFEHGNFNYIIISLSAVSRSASQRSANQLTAKKLTILRTE